MRRSISVSLTHLFILFVDNLKKAKVTSEITRKRRSVYPIIQFRRGVFAWPRWSPTT